MVGEPVERYIIAIIGACTPGGPNAIPEVSQYLRFGPSPRGAQALILCAKVNALLEGRVTVSYEDVEDAIIPCAAPSAAAQLPGGGRKRQRPNQSSNRRSSGSRSPASRDARTA